MAEIEPTIYLDMDGVLVDFHTPAFAAHGRDFAHYHANTAPWPEGEWDCEGALGLSKREFWEPLRGSMFWENLKPFPWGVKLFDSLSEMAEVVICTSPTVDPMCSAGKVAWMQKHLSNNFRSYFIGPKKHKFAKDPGAILIDDDPTKLNNFRQAGGFAITFPQRWNEEHEKAATRVEYVLGRVRERISKLRG